MFRNYLLIALQGLLRQPAFSAIKVLSLAIGLGCSILVIMHVQYALSFDKHFPNWERTYRLVTSLTTDQRLNTEISSDAYAPQMRLDYPQIEHIAKVRRGQGFFSRGETSTTDAFLWAEPDLIDIFSLDFISGAPDTALDEPNSVILSESIAAKYFPGEEAFGSTLTMEQQLRKVDLRVTGVYRDLPQNTHIEVPLVVSADTGRQLFGEFFMGGNAWVGFGGTLTYLTAPSPGEGAAIDADLVNFVDRNLPEQQRSFALNAELTLNLEPIADIYLSPRQGFGQGTNTRSQVLVGLSVFAVLILITSCINFANLSLSQVQQRNKEIGVRKTLGAGRGQIVTQFLFESLLLTGIALLLALPAVYFAIPVYTNLTSTDFTLASALSSGTVLVLPLFVLATGILSGLLPALALSRFEPAGIISGAGLRGRRSALFRSGVTVLQFGFSTALILVALAINAQIRHLNSMDIGFTKDNLLVLDSTYNPQGAGEFDYDAMVNELRQHPGVLAIGKASNPPPSTGSYNPWRLPDWGPNEFRPVSHYVVDQEYFDAMQFRLLAGRWFSPEFATDFMADQGGPQPDPATAPVRGIVITRYAVGNFGFDSPEAALDQIFMIGPFQYRVIGVIEDFRLSGGLEDVLRSTSILRAATGPLRALLLRIDPAQTDSVLAHIDEVWTRHRPDIPINRTFYNQTFSDLVYEQTNGISRASIFASIITVLISAFGLYALAFYTGLRRTKEVGVRKVLGATSRAIVRLLTWDFLKPVLLACALAALAGWFAIGVYFQQFSSRVEISPLLYLMVAAATVLVAVLTVALQCLRSANADPVESLRYE